MTRWGKIRQQCDHDDIAIGAVFPAVNTNSIVPVPPVFVVLLDSPTQSPVNRSNFTGPAKTLTRC
jgi:hypothetical protein